MDTSDIANHDRFFVLNLLTDIAYILIRISDDETAKFCLEHIDAMRAKIISPERFISEGVKP